MWLIDIWYLFAINFKSPYWNSPIFKFVILTALAVTIIFGGRKKISDILVNIDKKNYRKLKGAEAGLEGENLVWGELNKILKDDEKIYQNLKLNPNDKYDFDFVIVSPRKGVIILEVKDWSGTTTFYRNNIVRVDLNGKKRNKTDWEDPRKRINHNSNNLKKYLKSLNLIDLTIARAVVVVDGIVTVEDCGGIYIVKKIEELKKYIETRYERNLTEDKYQKLISALDKLKDNF